MSTLGNSMTGGVASNGVTPGASPIPLTSMSRCAKRLAATSVWAGIDRLPAVPILTTSGCAAPVQRISANLRASAAAAFTLPTPVYKSCAPAASSSPRDS